MRLTPRPVAALAALSVLAGCASSSAPGVVVGGRAGGDAAATSSAPIADVRYEVTFDSSTAAERTLRVAMSFTTTSDAPVILSLPAWTPGSYELSDFARFITDFEAEGENGALGWDKLDYDTWRVKPSASGRVTVRFAYRADQLDNGMAWSQPDFAFFNGTNVFLYPEGRPKEFAATVAIRSQPGWRVATGMTPAGAAGTYRESNYHDLVDKPFFVGRFDLDSMTIAGRTTRLASYPAGALAGATRATYWQQLQGTLPAMIAVTGDTPFDSYTTLIVVTPSGGGGSALEHANSHLGIYGPALLPSVSFPSITAHEIFHLWNVKRLRPVQMWPYDYAVRQPTPLLWVSEGITDYYADLALVRGGVIDSSGFLQLTEGKIREVAGAPAVSLEDASYSTWIHPIENGSIYYPKGSLVGFMLDILIRDASDNQGSLDTVMRTLYQSAYQAGRGFTTEEWWTAVSRVAGGRSFQEEYLRYVDGRDPLPWGRVLPLAGLRMATDTLHVPMLGVYTIADSSGTRIESVNPGGVAERAGVAAGDRLVSIGEVRVTAGEDFGPVFRSRYATRAGQPLPIVVRRAGRTVTLQGRVELATQVAQSLSADRGASDKARRIRAGIFHGR